MDVSTGKGPTVVSEIPSDFVAESVPRKVHVEYIRFVGFGGGIFMEAHDIAVKSSNFESGVVFECI